MAVQRGWHRQGSARSTARRRSFVDQIYAERMAPRLSPARLLQRLSVRRRIAIALATLVALAGAEVIINLRAMESAAFMLKRAEISHKELSAYQQLGAEALEYLVARLGDTGDVGNSEARRGRAEQRLAILDALTAREVELLQAHGENQSNFAEWARLRQIRSALQSIFGTEQERGKVPEARETGVSVYESRLKPLLSEAIAQEQEEVAGVQVAMRAMREGLRWFGAIGMCAQILIVGFVLMLVNRSVLDPLSRLVSDIKQYGSGTLGHRVAVRHHDEFGLLGRHINRMARHLERGRKDLLAAKAGLEATVAERTRALQDRNSELRNIDESRRRFFAEVSHELRTPLTAIVGEADVTLRIGSPEIETYRESLFSIITNSNFLNRRIDDLMALARSSDGRLGMRRETVDLNLVATEAMSEIRGLAKINNVLVAFEADDSPLLIFGDKTRLRQCVLILLDNAVKFSPPSSTVEIILRGRGESAELSVIDQGAGFTVGDAQRVFERFYQAEGGRGRGGFGLGLSIARRIVEAHDGTIVASTSDRGGAVVTIMFPPFGSVVE